MNYGVKDKRTLATKETLDELKKNPAVQEKLNASVASKKNADTKPNFQAGKRLNYFKDDLKVYGPVDPDASVGNSSSLAVLSKVVGLNSSRASTGGRDEDILKNLNQ